MICNSSYVLIIITLSVRLRTDESTSPGYPVKHIILSKLRNILSWQQCNRSCCRSSFIGVQVGHLFFYGVPHHEISVNSSSSRGIKSFYFQFLSSFIISRSCWTPSGVCSTSVRACAARRSEAADSLE